ncbi:MAG TPA: hypothetical protein VFQ45_02350 [Longimicrobium sp.]|nr:hypothetical protein [Longimicrobium sp.]
MTPTQTRLAACFAFLACAALAGVALVENGIEYRAFGMVEGVFALLLAHLLVAREAWEAPRTPLGWTAIVYATLATAQVLELLLPPPGMIEWMVIAGLAVTAWGAFAGGTRRRMLVSLASLALLLAVIKFSFVPIMWRTVGPPAGSNWIVGDVAEGFRRFFADYRPLRPASQLVGFAALALWALGTRLLWTPDTRGEPGAALVRIDP